MNVPSSDCSNSGACVQIMPRLEEGDRRMNAHENALNRIGSDLDSLKKDLHEVRVTLRERDGMMNFLRTVFVTLLAVFASGVIAVIVQVGTTVWWAAQLNAAVESNQKTLADHELRLRTEEKESKAK